MILTVSAARSYGCRYASIRRGLGLGKVRLRLAYRLRHVRPALRCSKECLGLLSVLLLLLDGLNLGFAVHPLGWRRDTGESITQGDLGVHDHRRCRVHRYGLRDKLLRLQEYLPLHLVDGIVQGRFEAELNFFPAQHRWHILYRT